MILDRKSLARSVRGLAKNSSGGAASRIRPPSMNTTRLAADRAKPISWLITIMVMPAAARSRMTSRTSLIISGSRAEGDVVEHALVGEQVELLEDHADVGAEPGQGPALVGQRPALQADDAVVDRLQPVDRPAQGRLARPRGPDHDHHLARVDLEVDVLEHVQVAEVLVDPLHLEQGRACRHPLGPPTVMVRWPLCN